MKGSAAKMGLASGSAGFLWIVGGVSLPKGGMAPAQTLP
jgi:hypothetical protein